MLSLWTYLLPLTPAHSPIFPRVLAKTWRGLPNIFSAKRIRKQNRNSHRRSCRPSFSSSSSSFGSWSTRGVAFSLAFETGRPRIKLASSVVSRPTSRSTQRYQLADGCSSGSVKDREFSRVVFSVERSCWISFSAFSCCCGPAADSMRLYFAVLLLLVIIVFFLAFSAGMTKKMLWNSR